MEGQIEFWKKKGGEREKFVVLGSTHHESVTGGRCIYKSIDKSKNI